jgi:hypothetical protein
MLTLNQIIDEIKAFGRSHGQLSDVAFCRAHEWLDGKDKKYAVLFFDYIRGRKNRNLLALNFEAWIADRTTPGDGNVPEVWSDSLLIACDLLSYLSRNDAPYTLAEGAAFTPFTDDTPDSLTGNKIEFTLEVPFPYDRCHTPLKKGAGIFTDEFTEQFT